MSNLKSSNKVGNHIQVGLNLANGITTGNPHGDANVQNAGIIALYESWAEHIGMTYADRTYGVSTSIGNSYLVELEETWNEANNHIPIGLYHDLFDGGLEPNSTNDDGSASTTVTDNVSGFTNQMMFNCLLPGISTVNAFQTQLLNTQLGSTSNTAANVNLLFDSY